MILLSADQNSESQQSVATRKRQQRPSQRQQPLDGPRPRQDQQNSQRWRNEPKPDRFDLGRSDSEVLWAVSPCFGFVDGSPCINSIYNPCTNFRTGSSYSVEDGRDFTQQHDPGKKSIIFQLVVRPYCLLYRVNCKGWKNYSTPLLYNYMIWKIKNYLVFNFGLAYFNQILSETFQIVLDFNPAKIPSQSSWIK